MCNKSISTILLSLIFSLTGCSNHSELPTNLANSSITTTEGTTNETTPIFEETSPNQTALTEEATKEETIEVTKKDDAYEVNCSFDSTKIEAGNRITGGYTAGGYAPTEPIEKYKDNGIEYWKKGYGTLFRENESQDLHNWVVAGYTRWRTVDTRIASRKGGEDNPRIAPFLSLPNTDCLYQCSDFLYNMVTVMKGTNNVSKDSEEFKEFKSLVEAIPGTYSMYTGYTEADEAFNSFFKENITEEENKLNEMMNYTLVSDDGEEISNTMFRYNCRNYCGDFICANISGYGVKTENEDTMAIAGTDYILTCPSDPDAFQLVEGSDLENYYEVYSYQGFVFIEKSNLMSRTEKQSAYMGVKPGIYDCKVTIPSTGDTFDITIENLPVSYSEYRWGCSTHEEMDTCVAFMQSCEYGIFNQYLGEQDAQSPKNYPGISLPLADEKEKLTAVDKFNSFKYITYDGEIIQLKKTADAAEWVCHLPGPKAPMFFDDDSEIQLIRGYAGHAEKMYIDYMPPEACKSFNALQGILFGAGDCESTSATMMCLYNVLGYSTRYITGGRHAWFEVKVPASITTVGKDQWMMVDGGIISGTITNDMVRTTVYDEQEGYDNSWWTLCTAPDDYLGAKSRYLLWDCEDKFTGYTR